MENVVLVRYAEIHLKGLNRPFFERILIQRIKESLKPNNVNIVREQGRIFVFGINDADISNACSSICKVFGVHSVSPAVSTEKNWDSIIKASYNVFESELKLSGNLSPTFKVFSKRADKKFPLRSEEICKELGHEILLKFPGTSVDVHKPEIQLHVEIRQNQAFIYTSGFKGVGGMPVGSNGKATLLISGGIDSPVAGYMISKRGVSLNAVHFYSYPYTSENARDKVIRLSKLLSSFTCGLKLYLVPFTDIQLSIYNNCPQNETTVLMRRQMMKIAERIALSEGSQALITGESIGQVASQTIEALSVTNASVSLPVFRPLIGFDKDEIVEYAKKIGTFETSIEPFEDCCTVFVPKHPVTKPVIDKILESETLVDLKPLIDDAISKAEILYL